MLPPAVQQIYKVVEVPAKTGLRHDTGVFAGNQVGFGVDSVGMDVVHEQKRGPVFVLFCNFGGEMDLLPERQVFDDQLLDLCRSLNRPLDARSAFY